MPKPRSYSQGTRAALFYNSGGLCYLPGCPEPVLLYRDGRWTVLVEIAHISAATQGGPRYDPAMTDDERRADSNLILLCDEHHQLVDEQPQYYTAEMLRRWKAQREADPRQALERLREVTPTSLKRLVAESLEEHDAKMLAMLDRLENADREAAALVRGLLDELTEAYSRLWRRVDAGAINELSTATRRLERMQGTLNAFIEATYRARRRGDGRF